FRLVVARHRPDGGDDLLVGDLVGGADETGVAAVHEDRAVALGVAAQRVDQLLALGVVERTEIHRDFSLAKGTSNFLSVGKSFPSVRRSDLASQLGHQEINSLVDTLSRAVDGKNLSPTKNVVTNLLRP